MPTTAHRSDRPAQPAAVILITAQWEQIHRSMGRGMCGAARHYPLADQ